MDTIYLLANGDLRLSANQNCQEAQAELEAQLIAALEALGCQVKRAHPYDEQKQHGFIDSQKYGMRVFWNIPEDAPLVVAEAVWQYSHHILHGLMTHKGPILTVANWSGTWPGLVGMLNLNGSLTKAGVKYSTLWGEDFTATDFVEQLKSWVDTGRIEHDTSHTRRFEAEAGPADAIDLGRGFARDLMAEKAILGVFDEGCMGMYNAIIPDELLNPTGIFKERLSQSALYAKMLTVGDDDAARVYRWFVEKGMKFNLGQDERTELTEHQVLWQCKMYIAALRIADEFGCATIGIQYQQGLKDLCPASDLVEGTLNNRDRPAVCDEAGRELYPGEALPHFNEVDECAGLDGLITYQLWRRLGFPPENTLHDLRWGRHYQGPDGRGGTVDDYVWVFLISGAAPPAHFIEEWQGAHGERQPPMYFPLGGSTLKGISKPGVIVWSRIYIEDARLKCDLGIGDVVTLPEEETRERWELTTPQWPIMHAVLRGITRDQMMARHKSNHIQVVYAPDDHGARRGVYAKAAALRALGLEVHLCGDI
jgi:hypothetical protein